MYNYDARLYDPVIGMFIMADTIIPAPYNPQSLDRYAYCLNNPVRYVDPSGHWGGDPDANGHGNGIAGDSIGASDMSNGGPGGIGNSGYEGSGHEGDDNDYINGGSLEEEIEKNGYFAYEYKVDEPTTYLTTKKVYAIALFGPDNTYKAFTGRRAAMVKNRLNQDLPRINMSPREIIAWLSYADCAPMGVAPGPSAPGLVLDIGAFFGTQGLLTYDRFFNNNKISNHQFWAASTLNVANGVLGITGNLISNVPGTGPLNIAISGAELKMVTLSEEILK